MPDSFVDLSLLQPHLETVNLRSKPSDGLGDGPFFEIFEFPDLPMRVVDAGVENPGIDSSISCEMLPPFEAVVIVCRNVCDGGGGSGNRLSTSASNLRIAALLAS